MTPTYDRCPLEQFVGASSVVPQARAASAQASWDPNSPRSSKPRPLQLFGKAPSAKMHCPSAGGGEGRGEGGGGEGGGGEGGGGLSAGGDGDGGDGKDEPKAPAPAAMPRLVPTMTTSATEMPMIALVAMPSPATAPVTAAPTAPAAGSGWRSSSFASLARMLEKVHERDAMRHCFALQYWVCHTTLSLYIPTQPLASQSNHATVLTLPPP